METTTLDQRWSLLIILLILFKVLPLNGQSFVFDTVSKNEISQNVWHYHIQTPEGTKNQQNINIVSICLNELSKRYTLELVQSDSIFFSTSEKAAEMNAIAAINGGFFDVKNGGSVSFIEINDEKVSERSMRIDFQAGLRSNIDAALIRLKTGELVFELARHSSDYLRSDAEKWILTAGPLLIKDSGKTDLLDNAFVNNRHPRSAVVRTATELLLIAVDGRHDQALGMSLFDLQNYIISLGGLDAINLDGGGSTTLWIDSPDYVGIVNCPSDNKKFDHLGERKVSNALIILKN